MSTSALPPSYTPRHRAGGDPWLERGSWTGLPAPAADAVGWVRDDAKDDSLVVGQAVWVHSPDPNDPPVRGAVWSLGDRLVVVSSGRVLRVRPGDRTEPATGRFVATTAERGAAVRERDAHTASHPDLVAGPVRRSVLPQEAR